jgi:hypothetical protein
MKYMFFHGILENYKEKVGLPSITSPFQNIFASILVSSSSLHLCFRFPFSSLIYIGARRRSLATVVLGPSLWSLDTLRTPLLLLVLDLLTTRETEDKAVA